MQTKTIKNMKHEWADGCQARSHGSEQVLITHTARAGLFQDVVQPEGSIVGN